MRRKGGGMRNRVRAREGCRASRNTVVHGEVAPTAMPTADLRRAHTKIKRIATELYLEIALGSTVGS